MTTAEQLRQLHITILKAISQAEGLLDNPDFEPGTFQMDYAFKMVQDLEGVIFRPLFATMDYLEIKYPPIEESEIL